MKRTLTAMAFCCAATLAFAQEHLTFKGIPITGSMTAFCQKLRDKGFTQIGKDKNTTLFTGDFTGRKATVGTAAADNGKDVFAVAVFLEESDSWNTLVDTYNYYKGLYVEKYGEPTQCVEENPSINESNVSRMHEVYEGTATYGSIFEAKGDKIQLSIEKGSGIYTGYVLIKYQDEQNVKAKRQSDLDEI